MQRTYFTDFLYDCFNKTVNMIAIHTLKIADLLKFLSMTDILDAAAHCYRINPLIHYPIQFFVCSGDLQRNYK